MSNESENKKDISAESNDASDDKLESNSSEDSQDNVSTESSKILDKNATNDKDTEDTKTTDSKQDDDEAKEKKENNLKKDEASEDKHSVDTRIKEVKDKKKEIEAENGETDEEQIEPTKEKIEEPSKKNKKGVTSNKVSEQPENRKKVAAKPTKLVEEDDAKEENEHNEDGKGTQLGEIPRVDASISRFKNDDLKLLYRLLFKTSGKTALIAKSIKKFNGFGFKKESEEYTKKIELTKKFELKQLKSICEMLDLEKKGTKDEIVERIIDFLLEPSDSGKQAGGGRPKRTAAVRANNRGYSSHDDSYSSDERRASRGGRGKGRRVNLKDDTTSESDEEFHLSDSSDTQSRSAKRKKPVSKVETDDEDVSDDDLSTDESGGDRKKQKTKKSVNSKPKPKATPAKRGRKPALETEKKVSTPKKVAGRKRAASEGSNPPQDENGSSSEDEPLIKKAKSPQPPTDEEIKKYVKEILDGANLEEITMKTVCKQVYAHYPDFDLAHKKDFIKSTVKSLIST